MKRPRALGKPKRMDIRLIEDHDEALRLWRREKIQNTDLVHLDAHIDFDVQRAQSPERLLAQARSLRDLKAKLEYAVAFARFEKRLDRQTNMGNYIYPALQENIVRDFYWVIPGDRREFARSRKLARKILGTILKREGLSAGVRVGPGKARLCAPYAGRRIFVCCLESLPRLAREVLLDIDTDFMVIDSIRTADNTKAIGRRKPWISPGELVKALARRLPDPRLTTIAYSVNGGFTPARFRHLADETAFALAPERFGARFKRALRAAEYFEEFERSGEARAYRRAVRLNARYRSPDNNYGGLYLLAGQPARAGREFRRVQQVDPANPGVLCGLGALALRKKEFAQAKVYFAKALRAGRGAFFKGTFLQSMLGLAQAHFGLKNNRLARGWLLRYKSRNPMDARAYDLLGDISVREKNLTQAARFYQDALQLGGGLPEKKENAKIGASDRAAGHQA